MSRKVAQFTRKNFKYSSTIKTALETLDEKVKKEVLRPAAYEGAQLLYKMLQMNAPNGGETMSKTPGLMRNSIYRYHMDRVSNETNQFYAVGINMKTAPHWHLVEYGHSQPYAIFRTRTGEWRTNTKIRLGTPRWTPAYPFIRKTFLAGEPLAVAAMRDELKERIKIAIRNTKVMP